MSKRRKGEVDDLTRWMLNNPGRDFDEPVVPAKSISTVEPTVDTRPRRALVKQEEPPDTAKEIVQAIHALGTASAFVIGLFGLFIGTAFTAVNRRDDH